MLYKGDISVTLMFTPGLSILVSASSCFYMVPFKAKDYKIVIFNICKPSQLLKVIIY